MCELGGDVGKLGKMLGIHRELPTPDTEFAVCLRRTADRTLSGANATGRGIAGLPRAEARNAYGVLLRAAIPEFLLTIRTEQHRFYAQIPHGVLTRMMYRTCSIQIVK